jgi:hypothetical protein
MSISFKCPQCVAASLTSYVGFVNPIIGADGSLLYCSPNGNFHNDNTLGDKIFYLCTQNHCGVIDRPAGL